MTKVRATSVLLAVALLATACTATGSDRNGQGGGLPPRPVGAPYWKGWDVARAIALSSNEQGGFVLDGYGGLHGFALPGHTAPATPSGTPYWNGQDLGRGLALRHDGTGGYVLDAWGGIHPFGLGGHAAPAAPTGTPYWLGWRIARSITLLPDDDGGYVLDGFGGVHAFGLDGHPAPALPSGTPYWTRDIARAIVLTGDGSGDGGYVLDGFGAVHPFALGGQSPPAVPARLPHWDGFDIARGMALFAAGSGYVLDGFGGIHPFAAPTAPAPPVTASTGAIRAAFYYPWFPGGWNQQGVDPYTNYHPSAGFYDGTQLGVVQQQIAAMQYGNISAGIASWWGAGSDTDKHMPTLLQAASGTSFKWTIYYENESLGDPSVATINADLTYLRDHYWSSPNWLRVDGKPVVFVYADANDGCSMAQRWKDANTLGAYVVLKVFQGYQSCAAQPQAWHQYAPASGAQVHLPYSYAVSPGFWKVGESPRLGRDVSRFRQDVAAMAASSAKFQLVTTFNEWGEGTAVESATEWATASGYGAYLDVLHDYPVAAPSSTSATTSTTVGSTPTTVGSTPTTAPPSAGAPCGTASASPARYRHVIWIWMENKSWPDVIGNRSAPYETQLANACGTATNWGDAGSQFPSEPSYVGATSGLAGSALNPFAGDAPPSATVSTTSDNIFRQVRAAGGTERSWEEGMNGNCSVSGTRYAPKHNPAVYFWGGQDRAACAVDDVPMGSATSGPFVDALRNDTLATFNFVTPDLCDDTHDCPVANGDAFLSALVPQILASPSYRRGDTALFVVWDEDTPIPNIVVAPSVRPGTVVTTPVSHYSLLRATEEMLGLPLLGAAQTAPSLRGLFNV